MSSIPCRSSLLYVRQQVQRRSLSEEALMAAAASACLGFGSVFLLLWCGVYLG